MSVSSKLTKKFTSQADNFSITSRVRFLSTTSASIVYILYLRVFDRARLTSRDQARLESVIHSKSSKSLAPGSDVYIWKHGNNGLLSLDEEQWRKEIINAAARCAREGDPVQASISSHLLHTVAGKHIKLT